VAATLLDKGIIESRLKGNTLRVYVFVLKKKKVGVREVQRSLGMSNPSLAQYHLNKLTEMGLLKENGGEYELSGEVKVDVMKDFLMLGALMVPRFVFYAAFFTVFSVYFVYLSIELFQTQPLLLWPAFLLAAATAIFWYEAQHAWRTAPKV
jgi:DNA-binding transcriptional ArsR family regulator